MHVLIGLGEFVSSARASHPGEVLSPISDMSNTGYFFIALRIEKNR